MAHYVSDNDLEKIITKDISIIIKAIYNYEI